MLESHEVQLGPGNRITRTTNHGGVAAICVNYSKHCDHYVLILGVVQDDVLLFDPLPDDDRLARKMRNASREITTTERERGVNLVLSRAHICLGDSTPYAMGPIDAREGVLIRRRTKKPSGS